MNFSEALEKLKEGATIKRKGWNHPNQILFLEKEAQPGRDRPHVRYEPFIAIRTVQKTIVPWFPSQTDLLGEDWVVCSEKVTE